MGVMEPASIASSALLIALIASELTYLSYHLWVSSAASKYSTPKGYLTKMPVVAFHIPIRDEPPALLERVLASIKQLKYPKDKIKVVVVCDDERTDELEGICREAQRELEVIFIHRKRARGFKAGALNEALKVESDVIVVLDVDSIIPSDFLVKALPSLYESNDVAAVIARWEPLNLKESLVSEAVSFGQTFFTRGLFRGLQALFGSSILIGNACLIKKDVLIRAGMWDEKCILEDVELGVRLRLKGHRVVYNDDVPVWVEHPSTYSDFKKQQKRWACGIGQVISKYFKSILTSKLKLKEKISWIIYLTQYWGLTLVGLSTLALPLLAFFNGEPPLLPLLPFIAVGALTITIYGYRLTKYRFNECDLIQGIKILGRTSALAMAMSLDIFFSSLKPLFKIKCAWRVTPKGPSKKTSKKIPKLELGLAFLPLIALIISALKMYLVLTVWSIACFAPLIYVVIKRFG
ncbi:MAG: glycosyltransferase family 2 protein [Candidatus Nezhaarchaeales archaeon]